MASTQKSNRQGSATKQKVRMFETKNDLEGDVRSEMVQVLNQQLADTFDLYTQTKQAHWNVKGPNFYQLHELYDRLAESIFPFIDEIAERVTALGGLASGTARMAASSSRLPEYPDIVDGKQSVQAMVGRYSIVAQSTRECAKQADEQEDLDTSDLLIEISRQLDKNLWFLEAHLQTDK